jgi:hypothetical protein
MRRLIFVLGVLLLLSGCRSPAKTRSAIVQKYQKAYPLTWEQKLLEYDIQQKLERELIFPETHRIDRLAENNSAFIGGIFRRRF